jgi:chromatin assembly factor 1 subunit A
MEQQCNINPWTDSYWEPEVKAKPTKSTQAGAEKVAKMAPPPAPTNAFAKLNGGESGSGAGPGKLVKAELMNDIKQTILDHKALSKVGMVEIIFQKFRESSVTRNEVKATIEHVAEKKGSGRSKEWELRDGHGIRA